MFAFSGTIIVQKGRIQFFEILKGRFIINPFDGEDSHGLASINKETNNAFPTLVNTTITQVPIQLKQSAGNVQPDNP